MNKRNQSLKKYGISGKRYKELCGFCEQYPEWKEKLLELTPTAKAQKADGIPYSRTNAISDETSSIAIKRAEIQEKIDLIEHTAKEADPEIWELIIKSACYEMPFWYLRDIMRIPYSERCFFDKRRYFFYLLDKKK